MRLKDEVAVITGGGSGIGRVTSKLFATEGAAVVVADVDEDGGNKTVSAIEEAGGKALFVRTNVTKENEVKALFDEAESHFGKVSIAFNNAGRMYHSPVAEMELSDYYSLFDLNVTGVFLGCKYAVPAMRRNGGGSIINTASAAALIGVVNGAVYCASKAAVIAYTRAVAAEVITEGIRLNCICPGLIDTEFYNPRYEAGADPEEFRKATGNRAPIGRMGRPEEIAHAVLYLASPEASYTTGSTMVVDGAVTAV
jgi:meso-butanediol dehydrogenase / (S,S)-butanediol dehydrogenase / diacetyl reductase